MSRPSKKTFLITQRLTYIPEYGEERESLDTEWYSFFQEVGDAIVLPISYRHEPEEFLSCVKVDGVILSGGNDVALHSEFESQLRPEELLSSKRDSFERCLIEAALKRGIPILGVCRGMQVISLYLGGKVRKISRHVGHTHQIVPVRRDQYSQLALSVTECLQESPLVGSPSALTEVNSFHNYGVMCDSEFCEGVEVLFLSPEQDSIECLVFAEKQVLALMWHPERSCLVARKRDIKIVRQLFWAPYESSNPSSVVESLPTEKLEAIVLCAGQGTRLRPLTDHVPKCMVKYKGRCLIDYILSSLVSSGLENITLVTGYQSECLVRPGVSYVHNSRYLETNMVGSLFCALEERDFTGDVLISYSDIIYNPSVVKALAQSTTSEVSVIIDKDWLTLWKSRMADPLSDAETLKLDSDGSISEIGKVPRGYEEIEGQYIGLLKFSAKGLEAVKELYYGLDRNALYDSKSHNNMYMTTLLQLLIDRGTKVQPVFINGGWIEVDCPEDLSVEFDVSDIPRTYHGQSINFGTKAETLAKLKKYQNFGVLPLEFCTWREYEESSYRTEFIAKCQRLVNENASLIVRSSAVGEDSIKSSAAGAYDSVLNVSNQSKDISAAVHKVFKSYSEIRDDNQVLVQPMLEDVLACGVLCTTELTHYMPYFVLSYEESGQTDGVTSGTVRDFKTVYTLKDYGTKLTRDYEWRESLYRLAEDLEQRFDNDKLDIEFAVDKDRQIRVLQVRPVVLASQTKTCLKQAFPEALSNTRALLRQILKNQDVLDNMMDWNPAEMIGVSPSPLARSLYEVLITDNVAMQSRSILGYRDVSHEPLMVNVAERCFIRASVSFASFIPADLDEILAQKLLTYYLDRMSNSLESRDKVEFDIAFTCFDLDLKARLEGLEAHGFSTEQQATLRGSLLKLTNRLFDRIDDDMKTVDLLPAKMKLIQLSQAELWKKVSDLVECTKRFGTLPFANLARSAFVSVSILRSLTRVGLMHDSELEIFMQNLQTVSKRMGEDVLQLRKGLMSKEHFLSLYGHLRPGTYDLCSSRYDEDFELYFPNVSKTHSAGNQSGQDELTCKSPPNFTLGAEREEKVSAYLKTCGIKLAYPELMLFCKKSIEGREHAKFVFTMAVSQILSYVSEMGAASGIHKFDLTFVNLKELLERRSRKFPYSSAHIGILRRQYQQNLSVKLPSTILRSKDLDDHFELPSVGNFVTKKEVCAPTVTEDMLFANDLSGKIVVVPSADPGWDWLFSTGIAGLVTCFGGANSHMSIRAAELSLPAAIGVGVTKFREINEAKMVQLNCASQQVNKV